MTLVTFTVTASPNPTADTTDCPTNPPPPPPADAPKLKEFGGSNLDGSRSVKAKAGATYLVVWRERAKTSKKTGFTEEFHVLLSVQAVRDWNAALTWVIPPTGKALQDWCKKWTFLPSLKLADCLRGAFFGLLLNAELKEKLELTLKYLEPTCLGYRTYDTEVPGFGWRMDGFEFVPVGRAFTTSSGYATFLQCARPDGLVRYLPNFGS